MNIQKLLKNLIRRTKNKADQNQIRAAHAVVCAMITVATTNSPKLSSRKAREHIWGKRYHHYLKEIVAVGDEAPHFRPSMKVAESKVIRLRRFKEEGEESITKRIIRIAQHGADAILAEIHHLSVEDRAAA